MVATLEVDDPKIKVTITGTTTSLTLTLSEWVAAYFDLRLVPEFLTAVREEANRRGSQ